MGSAALLEAAEEHIWRELHARQEAMDRQAEAWDNEQRIEAARWRLGGE